MMGKLTEQEVFQFVKSNHIGRLGCHDGERTYVVPVSYLFFNDHFLCYSLDGLKIEMMRENPEVCVEIDEITDFHNWKSVIAFGKYEEITDKDGINAAERYFSDITLNLKAKEASLPPEATRPQERAEPIYKETIYYRIWIQEISGRFEREVE